MHSASLNITSISMFILFFVYFTVSDSYILYFLATYFSCGSVVVVLTGLTFCSYRDFANALHIFFLFLNYSGIMYYVNVAFHESLFFFTSHHVNFIVNIPLAMNFLFPILNDELGCTVSDQMIHLLLFLCVKQPNNQPSGKVHDPH